MWNEASADWGAAQVSESGDQTVWNEGEAGLESGPDANGCVAAAQRGPRYSLGHMTHHRRGHQRPPHSPVEPRRGRRTSDRLPGKGRAREWRQEGQAEARETERRAAKRAATAAAVESEERRPEAGATK